MSDGHMIGLIFSHDLIFNFKSVKLQHFVILLGTEFQKCVALIERVDLTNSEDLCCITQSPLLVVLLMSECSVMNSLNGGAARVLRLSVTSSKPLSPSHFSTQSDSLMYIIHLWVCYEGKHCGLAGLTPSIETHITQFWANEGNRYLKAAVSSYSITVVKAHYEETVIVHQGYENSQFTQQKSMLH